MNQGPKLGWLLVAVVFLLPWQARWIYLPVELNGSFWEYGSFSLYATEVLLWVTLVSAAVAVLRQRDWRVLPPLSWRRLLTPRGVVFVSTLLLLAAAWASVWWAADRAVALQAVFRLTEAVALFYLVVLQPATVRQRFIAALVLSAGVQGVIAAIQFFAQAVFGSTWLGVDPQLPSELGASVLELAGGRWLRAYGTFPHPNILAGFLALGILLGAHWCQTSDERLQRVAAFTCGALAAVGLVLTFSRSGMLAAAAGMLVCLTFTALRARRVLVPLARYALAVVLAAAATVALVLPQAAARLRSAGRLEAKSVVERRELTREGWIVTRRALPWGVGIGNATVAASRVDPTRPAWSYQPAHNLFLLILLELGVAGLLGFIGVLFGLLRLARGRRQWYGVGLITSFAVLGWLDHYLWSLLPGILMLWVGLGVAAMRSPSGGEIG